MKKKKRIIVIALFVFAIIIGLSSNFVSATECMASNGATCEGECCKITKHGCIAGPCKYILWR